MKNGQPNSYNPPLDRGYGQLDKGGSNSAHWTINPRPAPPPSMTPQSPPKTVGSTPKSPERS
jgi:hypothetical protein